MNQKIFSLDGYYPYLFILILAVSLNSLILWSRSEWKLRQAEQILLAVRYDVISGDLASARTFLRSLAPEICAPCAISLSSVSEQAYEFSLPIYFDQDEKVRAGALYVNINDSGFKYFLWVLNSTLAILLSTILFLQTRFTKKLLHAEQIWFVSVMTQLSDHLRNKGKGSAFDERVAEKLDPLTQRLYSIIDEISAEHTLLVQQSAIARTTQMLAHDVRKPFSLFRMTIERVKSASNAQQVQSVLQEALPEVERSLANVNGLITDVLNVGGEFKLVLKPVRLAAVVEDVVDEVRKLNPTRMLNVKLNMDSETWVEADDTRLPRVFLNILSNAVEAVNSSSVHLWISAQHVSRDSLEVRVGNAGSFIEPDAREKLFDLFYTSGKKGGTGLGLAIVKKIIAGHGSTVECLSEKSADFPDGKVEFVWTMKRANAPVEAAVSEVQLVSETLATPSTDKPQVVFLDDSPLARWVWDAKLKNQVAFRSFAGPREFWAAVENQTIVLQALHTIITDHYFAPDENLTGVEFAAALRKQGFKGRILLASSGEFDPQQLAGIVDKIVDKQPTDWDKL